MKAPTVPTVEEIRGAGLRAELALRELAAARAELLAATDQFTDEDEAGLLERNALEARRESAGALLELEGLLAQAVGTVDLPTDLDPADLARWVRAAAEDVAQDRAWADALRTWSSSVRLRTIRGRTSPRDLRPGT